MCKCDDGDDGLNYIDIAEFRSQGYLQELNRQFLHPLGLAIEVVVEDDGTERLGRVWDYRHDPEGIAYHVSMDLSEKANQILQIQQERWSAREEALGFWIQPAEGASDD